MFVFFSFLTALFTSSCGEQPTAVNGDTVLSRQALLPPESGRVTGDTVVALDPRIFVVFQDRDHHYWFGSDGQGVYRYDGKHLLHFTTRQGLCNDSIREIQQDEKGAIFFTTRRGISRFDGHRFTTLPVVKMNSPAEGWRLHPDDLWFRAEDGKKGPCRYDGQSLYQLEFPRHSMEEDYYARFPNNAWSPYDIYCIYKDHRGMMWFGTSNFGICRYDGRSLSWMYEDHLQFVPGGGSFGIRSILEDAKGKFWFCNTHYRYTVSPAVKTGEGKSLLSYKKEKGIEGFKAPDGADDIYYLSIVEDDKGNLWMVTYAQGVWQYDGKQMKQYRIQREGKDMTSYSIYQDRSGGLWVGTHEAGVYKFNGKEFEQFKPAASR